MIPVGLLARRASSVKVKLTPRTMPESTWDESGERWNEVTVVFSRNGGHSAYGFTAMPDEWAFPKSATVGDGYEIMLESVPVGGRSYVNFSSIGLPNLQWVPLNQTYFVYMIGSEYGDAGTARIRIRDATSKAVLATADYVFQ